MIELCCHQILWVEQKADGLGRGFMHQVIAATYSVQLGLCLDDGGSETAVVPQEDVECVSFVS